MDDQYCVLPNERRRVLVSAYATSPYLGSEPGGGWNVVSRLAQYHDVTVLCCPGLQHEVVAAYETFLSQEGEIPGLHLEWIEQPPLSRIFQREGVPLRLLYYLGYQSWERRALARALELHATQPFDLVHRLNMTGFREPGYLWKMDLPYVWGPIAGAVMMPMAFFSLLGWRDKAIYGARNIVNRWQMATKRRCRRAAQRSSMLWAVDDINQSMIRRYFGAKSDIMLDSGCELATEGHIRQRGAFERRPLRIIWSGVHQGRKCLPILLHALVSLEGVHERFRLSVLSEGPQTSSWRRLSQKLGIDDLVEWTGHLPHEQAVRRMHDADVFVLTSLQEAATHVIMEALASGLPVLCHEACGMGVAIDDRCGIKIPLTNPHTSIMGFAAALNRLDCDEELLPRLSRGALARAHELSWDRKVRRIVGAYESVMLAE